MSEKFYQLRRKTPNKQTNKQTKISLIQIYELTCSDIQYYRHFLEIQTIKTQRKQQKIL